MNDIDKKNEKVIKQIIENYENLESSIVSQLLLETPNHHPTTGTYREQIWKALFQQIIPKKFAIEQGVFIIDSYGKISSEVDLAIFDEQYTPYIFNYGKIRFIPIEAVVIGIQCKSKRINAEDLNNWCKTIDDLKTTQGSIARMEGFIAIDNARTQPATKPIKILCSLSDSKIRNFDIKISIKKRKLRINIDDSINTLINAFSKFNGLDKLETVIPPSNKLEEIKRKMEISFDKYIIENNSILSLIFQLNQLLMLINNPMLFPHQAYVEMFNKHINKC